MARRMGNSLCVGRIPSSQQACETELGNDGQKGSTTDVTISAWWYDHLYSEEAYRDDASEPARSGADRVVAQPLGPSALALASRRRHRRHRLAAPGRFWSLY